MTNGTFPDTLL